MDDVPHAPGLSELERAILRCEAQWWARAADKEDAIRGELKLSPTQYYQVVGRLLDRPEAMEFDPMLITRLRRMRDERAESRSTRAWKPPHAG